MEDPPLPPLLLPSSACAGKRGATLWMPSAGGVRVRKGLPLRCLSIAATLCACTNTGKIDGISADQSAIMMDSSMLQRVLRLVPVCWPQSAVSGFWSPVVRWRRREPKTRTASTKQKMRKIRVVLSTAVCRWCKRMNSYRVGDILRNAPVRSAQSGFCGQHRSQAVRLNPAQGCTTVAACYVTESI